MDDTVAAGNRRTDKKIITVVPGLSWSPEFRYGIGLQTGIYYELSTDSYNYYDNSII